MSATHRLHGRVRPAADDVNNEIRRFVRARRGCVWSAQDRDAYARLLTAWTEATRDEAVATRDKAGAARDELVTAA